MTIEDMRAALVRVWVDEKMKHGSKEFHRYIKTTYGIELSLGQVTTRAGNTRNAITSYKVVDESKYLIFLMLWL